MKGTLAVAETINN